MNQYFSNPEIKISSTLLLFIITLFFLITSFALKVHNDNLKDNYVKSLGAVVQRLINENPEIEKEIMPLITKRLTEEEALKGEIFLAQYGLSKELESSLFPYINESIIKNNYFIIFIFVVLAFILFSLNYFQYSFFYKRIRNIILGAKKVLDGNYDISIREDSEGDFSKLANSFNSMRDVIQNNISELKSEKQFLADLLSDISHQLKTPLASLILYNDIMLNKELTKKRRESFLINDKNQLYRMNWLIKNVLKLAKLDAKAVELDKELQSLKETIEESIDALQSKAFEGVVRINFTEAEEICLNHDRLWMEEALNNIMKNAIEHTHPNGNINIELMENPIYIRIKIEDNGEGISEEDLPNIFKRFYKGKASKKNDSIGIGLSLSKAIIEDHGGIIEVQSKVTVGTKFVITFLKY